MTERAKDTGVVRSAGMHEDEAGKQVLRVVVDFYDGDAPGWDFSVIFHSAPVKIVLARTAGETAREGGKDATSD